MLDEEARRKQWSKSFLIRDILIGWVTYQRATGMTGREKTDE